MGEGFGIDTRRGGFSWRAVGTQHADRAPVVLLHGLMGSRLSWEPQLDELSAHRHVVAWDLPSYGLSDALPSPVTFTALADAVARFADVLGADRIHLVGLSFGGMIAQYAAAEHPDRIATLSLLATSPKFGLDGTNPQEWRAARLAALDAGVEPIDFAPAVLASLADPGIAKEVLAGQVRAAAEVPGAALRTSIDVLITHDSRAILHHITAPTQCLVGEHDPETPVAYASAIADQIAGAGLHVVPGAGHLLNVEAPAIVNRLLNSHFDASEPKS